MSEQLSPIKAMMRIRVDRKGLVRDAEQAGKAAGSAAGGRLEQGVADGAGDKSGRIRRESQKTNERLAREAGKAGRKAGDNYAGGLMGGLQRNSTKLTMGVTAPLAALGAMAYRTYAEAADAADATTVIFGESADAIDRLADSGAQNLGMSEKSVYELANRLGGIWQGIGLSQESSAEKSAALVQRAADMASLYGTRIEDAAAALASGLVGETEPMKKFGVVASEAAVSAFAISEGLVEAEVDAVKLEQAQVRVAKASAKVADARRNGTDLEARSAASDLAVAEQALADILEGKVPQMDDTTKALARYEFMLSRTDVAANNFAQTSESDANKLRIAAAEAENATTAFGEKLAPAMGELTDQIVLVLEAWNKLPSWMQTATVIAAMVAAAAGPLGKLIGLWNGVAAAAGRASTAQITASRAGMGAGGAGLAAKGGMAAVAGKGAVLAAAGYGGYKVGEAIGNAGAGDWLADQGWFSSGAKTVGGWLGDLDTQGVVAATPGGSIARIAEAGNSEVVAHVDGPRSPFTKLHERLDSLEGQTGAVTVNVHGDANDPERIGREVEKAFKRASARAWDRNGGSLT